MNATLSELSTALADVATAASPSVVGVGRAGSGVIVADGLVVTNAHNLRDQVSVSFDDGTSVSATVAGADVEGDLAVLRVPTGGRAALGWAESTPSLGSVVIGLSRPGGQAVRVGVVFVSGLGLSFRGPDGRTVTGALEHSAPLARGSSGGPVVDNEGHLVGINTHREGEGFYLALPAGPELKDRIDRLSKGEVPRRVRLGVALAPPVAARRLRRAVGLPPRDGLLVHAVEPEGPADRAGIRRGDLIVSTGTRSVVSVEDLALALEGVEEGGSTQLLVVRGVEEISVVVHFGPSGPAQQGTA